MFEKLKILKEAGAKLYPYFTPSYNNLSRVIGLFSSTILVPAATIIMPLIFLKWTKFDDNSSEDNNINYNNTNTNFPALFVSASAVALINGVQKGLSMLLTISTMQAMKAHKVQQLMDESKFLIHGDNKGITSIQYITVGVGVRDFVTNTVPIFTALPMYAISAVNTLAYIGLYTELAPLGIVLGFATVSGVVIYSLSTIYSSYQANNQKIENDLVAKINFIEANKSAISLMGASDSEHSGVIHKLDKVNPVIPKLSLVFLSYNFFVNLAPAVASQLLGGYYTDSSIKKLGSNEINFLNFMIMSLLTNVQNISFILTNNYSYIKLNLEQLKSFDKAYDDCLLIQKAHNKMKQKFVVIFTKLNEKQIFYCF